MGLINPSQEKYGRTLKSVLFNEYDLTRMKKLYTPEDSI